MGTFTILHFILQVRNIHKIHEILYSTGDRHTRLPLQIKVDKSRETNILTLRNVYPLNKRFHFHLADIKEGGQKINVTKISSICDQLLFELNLYKLLNRKYSDSYSSARNNVVIFNNLPQRQTMP